jgi:hypothetical protein
MKRRYENLVDKVVIAFVPGSPNFDFFVGLLTSYTRNFWEGSHVTIYGFPYDREAKEAVGAIFSKLENKTYGLAASIIQMHDYPSGANKVEGIDLRVWDIPTRDIKSIAPYNLY